MPINSILAPYYIKATVTTGVARHTQRLYFRNNTVISPDGAGDFDHVPANGSATRKLSAVLLLWHTLLRTGGTTPVNSSYQARVTNIEVWKSVPNFANTFMGFCPALGTDVPASPSGTYYPSSYRLWLFSCAFSNILPTRQKMQALVYDTQNIDPQRAGFTPVTLLDTTLTNYLFNPNNSFGSQDGAYPVAGFSVNTGYNRKLARAYGRGLAPIVV